MKARQIIGLVLIALGVLGLVYGGFSYTEATHDVGLGPLEFQVKEKDRVNVPMWLSIGGIVVGATLLIAGRSSRAG
jgi:uncharacterized membrane protein YidH (DUF202 family)